jgi:predicted ester cyclase
MVEAKQVLERAVAAWNRGDVEGFVALADADVRIVTSGGIDFRGAEGMRDYFALWRTACPDNRVNCRNIVGEGDRVMGEGTFSGTHNGPLHHPAGAIPPTGRRLKVDFVGALHTADGKFASFRTYFDVLDLMSQLGLIGLKAKH